MDGALVFLKTLKLLASRIAGGRKAAAHGVFGDRARDEELQQVVGSAGLGADAGHLEAAERLALHEGAGDLAVDVEVADAEFAADALKVLGTA